MDAGWLSLRMNRMFGLFPFAMAANSGDRASAVAPRAAALIWMNSRLASPLDIFRHGLASSCFDLMFSPPFPMRRFGLILQRYRVDAQFRWSVRLIQRP
jgi:hypothetical protein